MNTKYIHHIFPSSPIPYLLLLYHWYPPQEKTYFSFLFLIFLKCILIVQGGEFLGIPDMKVSYFNWVNPSITYSIILFPSFISFQFIYFLFS
jgi:hypothetical protein